MERIKPRTLSGFMELLPAQQQQMERVMDILRTTYSRYGFTPLDTPIMPTSLSRSAVSRSERSTAASARSAAASASSIRRISTSSATASWTS